MVPAYLNGISSLPFSEPFRLSPTMTEPFAETAQALESFMEGLVPSAPRSVIVAAGLCPGVSNPMAKAILAAERNLRLNIVITGNKLHPRPAIKS